MQGTNSMASTSTWSGLGEGEATKPARQVAAPLNQTQHLSFMHQRYDDQDRNQSKRKKRNAEYQHSGRPYQRKPRFTVLRQGLNNDLNHESNRVNWLKTSITLWSRCQ